MRASLAQTTSFDSLLCASLSRSALRTLVTRRLDVVAHRSVVFVAGVLEELVAIVELHRVTRFPIARQHLGIRYLHLVLHRGIVRTRQALDDAHALARRI